LPADYVPLIDVTQALGGMGFRKRSQINILKVSILSLLPTLHRCKYGKGAINRQQIPVRPRTVLKLRIALHHWRKQMRRFWNPGPYSHKINLN
jgi:hypothetical protein